MNKKPKKIYELDDISKGTDNCTQLNNVKHFKVSKKTLMFMKTVIFAEKVVLATRFFYEKFVFADKYVILAVSTLPPLMGNFF